jgi:acetyl-CoA carboxylase biotin carboxyl carrier protein
MELKQIKELMAVMQRTGTKRLVIKKDGIELELEREDKTSYFSEPPVDLLDDNPMRQEIAMHRANMLLARGGEASSPLSQSKSEEVVKDTNSQYVISPMVGTFYGSPSPEDPSFVKVGDRIEKDSVVCIIEAMKVMNEVKANLTGTIMEILVSNGQPVEFGTKLFRITA